MILTKPSAWGYSWAHPTIFRRQIAEESAAFTIGKLT